jgi:hypothetical protein
MKMKRFLLKTTYLTIFLANFSFPQWSNDPNNNLVLAVGWDPHIASDSAGGCYVTYNYDSFYPQKLAVERLDKYGYKPWADRKQILGELPEQWQAEIIEDEEGGVIISYEDNQVVGTDFTSRVRVQKVDSNGNFLWGQTGVRVTTEETNHGIGGLVSDGDGGCIIVWQNYDERILMNRIDRTGQRVWSETGIFLINTGTNVSIVRASDGNHYVQVNRNLYRISGNGEIIRRDSVTLGNMIPVPAGGLVLSGKTGSINDIKLVAQRKDSLGNNLWQEPYVEIADSLYINTELRIQFNSGYYCYGWSGTKNGINRIAQFQALRFDGSKLFSNGSIEISENTPIGSPYIIPSDSGRTILIWNDATIASSTMSQMYDTLGNILWDDNGIVVSYPAIAYENTTDGQGGFITIGPINQFTIIAQQVSKYGNLGEIITSIPQEDKEIFPTEIILYQNYPNPFNSTTVIKYLLADADKAKISIYNILGEQLEILSDGYQSQGTHSVNFDSDNFPSGVYIYTLETNNKVLTKKLTIIK